jgi:hypothetical protein
MTKKTIEFVSQPYEWADGEMEELRKTYWATHGREPLKGKSIYELLNKADELRNDPWSNGRYALSALVWGLILLVVFGVGAGP